MGDSLVTPKIPRRNREQLLREIDEGIRHRVGAFVSLDEIRVLCPGCVSISEEFRCIAEFAKEKACSFGFIPGGLIRFKPLEHSASASS